MAFSRRYLWLLVPAALAAILAVLWWFSPLRRSLDAADFRYLPADCAFAVHLDVAGLRDSPLVRRALRAAPPSLEAEYAQFVRETGFDYERDLDSVALGISGPEGARALSAVLQGRFRREKLDVYIVRKRQATSFHEGHNIDTFLGPSGKKFRISFLGSGRLLFSNAPHSRTIETMVELSRRSGDSLGRRLAELKVLRQLQPGTQVWVAADMEKAGTLRLPAAPGSGTSFTADLLRASRMVVVSAHLESQQVELRMVAEYPNGEEARRVVQALNGLRGLLAALAERRPDAGAWGGEFARALQSMSISQDRHAAVARANIPNEFLERLLVQGTAPKAGN